MPWAILAGREKENLGNLQSIKDTTTLAAAPQQSESLPQSPGIMSGAQQQPQQQQQQEQPGATTMSAQVAASSPASPKQDDVLRLRGGGNVFADCLA